MTKQELIEAAFACTYSTPEALVEDVAREHALTNMGMSLADYVDAPREGRPTYPERLIHQAYQRFYQSSESDEMANAIDRERKHWLKDARRDVKKVQRTRLPLTMANARDAFEETGAFAKK